MSILKRLALRLRYGRPVVVVSGLPRSGTSMAMKMLAAGGMAAVDDGVRSADEDNPRGYFEDGRVQSLGQGGDGRWVREARGRVIKVVSSLLQYLPRDNFYKVVFMRRNLSEVLVSQSKMLARRGETSSSSDEELLAAYSGHLEKVEFQLRYRRNFEALYVSYLDVLQRPEQEARRINDFLGGVLDERRMAEAVDPELYRNRAERLSEAN